MARPSWLFCLALATALHLFTRPALAAEEQRLLRSAAFSGNIKTQPKWLRVVKLVGTEMQGLERCKSLCPAGAGSWKAILEKARGKPPKTQLRLVSAFFNKWPYRLDSDVYGVTDWWASPQEFLRLSGDCEDYAITKYFALRQLGFPAKDLRIVVLKDRIRGIGHAVVAVKLEQTYYILDNLTDIVFAQSTYTHYVPVFSVNENHLWLHIPTKGPKRQEKHP